MLQDAPTLTLHAGLFLSACGWTLVFLCRFPAGCFSALCTHVFFFVVILCNLLGGVSLFPSLQHRDLTAASFPISDGQRRTCRRQLFSLPSANETFAIGKCLAGRRQNSYRINGKQKVCQRQIFSLSSANLLPAARGNHRAEPRKEK